MSADGSRRAGGAAGPPDEPASGTWSAHGDPLAAVPRQLLVGGRWRPARAGASFSVEDPSTGTAIAEVADARPDDGIDALGAAASAQSSWAETPPGARSELLHAVRDALMARREDLAAVITLEMGKPLAEARAEVDYAAAFFGWFAGEALRLHGDYRTAPSGAARIVVLRQPVGPALLVTPWNFPLAMGARKLAPALAAGCTTVIKPAPQTPLSTLDLADILVGVGVPPGVVNVVPTTSAAAVVRPLLADGRLRKLSFTGSTAVGRLLFAQASEQLLRCSFELGGNAPFVVLPDADVEQAVEAALVAKLRNGGQACVAANRFLVAGNLAPDFTEALADRFAALRVGPGLDEATDVGPLIDAAALDKVSGLVGEAADRGAKLVVGGNRCDRPGHFYEPTVLGEVPPGARVLSEEVFGPVAPVVSFDSEAEALAMANDTEHGLVAYVFTRDLDRALRWSERLEAGMVGCNQGMVSDAAAPFGGVKHSGIGREGGREGIEEYVETKYVAVRAGA